jgi:methylglutaconyl-CoA hydratase
MFIKTDKQKHVTRVSLSRPDVHNAFNSEMISELTQIFKSIATDKAVRAVVLNGLGKSFSAGADIDYMKSMASFDLEENIKDARTLFEMFEAIFDCPVPVLAQVHGNVLGGGIGLVAVCDIVAAERETRFGFTEVKLGLAPAVISPFVMKKISENHARELMMTGEIFDSARAERMGLIGFSGEGEEVSDFIQTKLEYIKRNGPEAVRSVKRMLREHPNRSWLQSKDETIKLIAALRVGPEGQDGLHSFLSKRDPQWKTD